MVVVGMWLGEIRACEVLGGLFLLADLHIIGGFVDVVVCWCAERVLRRSVGRNVGAGSSAEWLVSLWRVRCMAPHFVLIL